MPSMDIFNNKAFSMASLTSAVTKIDYVPNLLGSLGLFTPKPIRTKAAMFERKEGKISLIATSADGSAPEEAGRDERDILYLKTARLAKGFTLYAYELQGIRGFGSETELQAVQAEWLNRMDSVRTDMELTHEYHRLGALQGKLLDADGTTVIYDYFEEFAEPEAAAITWNFSDTNFDVRGECQKLKRSMSRSAKGAFTPATQIHALVGDEFFDALISHPQVEKSYLNWAAAQDLRENKAFESFSFGGVTWHNYRGTDDNSTVAIPVNQAKFFPVGARDVFVKAMSPHETMAAVNTLGRDLYAMNIRDKDRDMWVKGELYSYPLYACQQPRVLRKGVQG